MTPAAPDDAPFCEDIVNLFDRFAIETKNYGTYFAVMNNDLKPEGIFCSLLSVRKTVSLVNIERCRPTVAPNFQSNPRFGSNCSLLRAVLAVFR